MLSLDVRGRIDTVNEVLFLCDISLPVFRYYSFRDYFINRIILEIKEE